MQLLKMELRGFKSFADKTVLTFDKGVTAIVGPNGSGKSNISDAVRWVMGEQNVRQLRGQRAEDIIFSGTAARRPQGAAEVSLFFDNSDKTLDTEYREVVITRRYFRSGDSEFYINKRPCRLKDIHHLFADTGIGQDSMAVIGQNRVDRILNSKPEERRVIFEEVAGISRFKGRKEEGLKKIKETEHNLARIQDMTSLLEERLGPITEQAEKLKLFRLLDGERQAYEGTLALQEMRNFERLLAKAELMKQQAVSESGRLNEAIAGADEKRQEILASIEEEESLFRALNETAATAKSEAEGLKTRQEAYILRAAELEQALAAMSGEEKSIAAKELEIDEKITALRETLEECNSVKNAADRSLKLTERLYNEAALKAGAAEAASKETAAADRSRREEEYALTRDIEELNRRLEDTRERYKEAADAAERATELLRESRAAEEKTAAELERSQNERERLQSSCNECRIEAETAAHRLEKCEEKGRNTSSQLDGLKQRIRVLEGMEQEHEGFGRAVKTVLTANEPWRSRICGVVGEACRVPDVYATAVDTALGGASRFIIAESEEAAKQAVAYLKREKAGRTTFLPLDTVRPRPCSGDEERALHENGIIGTAKSLIEYDHKYENVFSYLLERTLVAATVDGASAVARKYGGRLRIVCVDGTLFNAGGSLTGGSVQNKESSIVGRHSVLCALRKEAAAVEKRLSGLVAVHRKLSEARSESVRNLNETERHFNETANKVRQLVWEKDKQREDGLRLKAELRRHEEAKKGLTDLRASIQATLAEKKERLAALSLRTDNKPGSTEAAYKKYAAEAEQYRQALTERQIEAARLEEQTRHLSEQIEQQNRWRDEHRSEAAALTKRRHDTRDRLDKARQAVEKTRRQLALKEAETREKEAEKEAFYKSREGNFRANQELEDELRRLRDEAERRTRQCNAADIQIEKYNGEIMRSEEKLAAQGLTRQEAMERRRDGSLRELQDKVSSLKSEIAGLGPINPNADEEHREVAEKAELYKKQSEDLLESRAKLTAVVAEIDKAMAAQFGTAFAEIGSHFQRIFSRLFGGGTAEIALTDVHNILECGVEFLIQPPGKKRQSLTLLSGGERALTVIALLLAFLAYHPAPFCLVDEVDAALDEANVDRMAKYLKNYSGDTQFIVITHRRKSMEAANTLQGVTMEEKGVSKLLTVQVDELMEKGT